MMFEPVHTMSASQLASRVDSERSTLRGDPPSDVWEPDAVTERHPTTHWESGAPTMRSGMLTIRSGSMRETA